MVVNEIIEKVSELSKIPRQELSQSTELYNSSTLSSLSLLALMAFVEKRYAIAISPEELFEDNFKDIKSLAEFIGKKRESASAACA